MGALGTIWQKLKEIINRMIGSKTIEQTLNVSPLISSKMEKAIELWGHMYDNQAPWLKEPDWESPVRVTSLGLPAMIASEKARTALIELKTKVSAPYIKETVPNPDYDGIHQDEFGTVLPSAEPQFITKKKFTSSQKRAQFLDEQLTALIGMLRPQLEYGIAKGGIVIKPYPIIHEPVDNSDVQTVKFGFDFVQADCFYPLGFDNSQITEAAFVQTIADKDMIYRRLEYHKWSNNTVTIVNKAFKSMASLESNMKSDANGYFGVEIPLTDVLQWKDLKETVTLSGITRPLFAYFKMPEANTIDSRSPLGVSGYSRAVGLIKDADEQYSRLLWEYEGGELAIDIDRDATQDEIELKSDGSTVHHSVMSKLQSRLYRKVDLGQADTYQPYAPTLRDNSYLSGLNAILKRIEDTIGLSRGTLSDPNSDARTATELKTLRQRSYQTNSDIQKALEAALKDVLYIMDTYCTLYKVTPEGKYEVSFDWDDSILVDTDTELSRRIQLMNAGLVGKVETRMWYFNETEEQAIEALQKIEEENMLSTQSELSVQTAQLGNGTTSAQKITGKSNAKPKEMK